MQEQNTETERKMTFQEKIDYIDHEIRMLHRFCKQTGYSAEKINEFAQPFVVEIEKGRRRNNYKCFLYLSLLVVLFGLSCYGMSSHPLGKAAIRLTVIQFYPLYQWIELHKDECFIRNPLYVDQYLTEEDCELCNNIEKLERVTNLTEEKFVEQFLMTGAHVIVENGMKDWPESLKSFTIQKFKQAYQNEPVFHDSESCDFNSNLPYGNIDKFVERESHIKRGYYITWTNCAKQAAKALRKFYKRPYFLPASVETFEQNFLFFSKQYKGKEASEVKTETAIIILQQVKGSIKFYLTPEEPCNNTCVHIEDSLKQGEILIAMNTHKIWILEIQGTDGEENITIGIEGNYN